MARKGRRGLPLSPAPISEAGPAPSMRLRNSELQSFTWIHAYRNHDSALQVIAWDGHGFDRGNLVRLSHDGQDWQSRTIDDASA